MPDVALFVPTLGGGGAERATVVLAGGLRGRGLDVDLVCVDASGPLRELVAPGVRLVDLGASRALRAVPALVRYLARERPGALLAVLDRSIVLAVAARALGRSPTRVIGQVQSTMSAASSGSPRWQDRLRPILARLAYPRARRIVAVSDGVARDLEEGIGLPAGHVEVIHNPVVTPDLADRAEEPCSHPWFAPDAPPVVIAVGRLTRQKDFPTLLRAFARVRERRDTRLVVFGEGEERGSLLALAADLGVGDDVDLPGYVPNPYACMARAGVFVLSSAWEGLPTVLIEALAAGAPVVSTDCPSGPREILDGGRYGALVPVGDAAAMAAAIAEALDRPTDPSLLRGRAQAYSLDALLPAYLRVLGWGDD